MTAQAPEYKCRVCGHTFDVLESAVLSLRCPEPAEGSKDGTLRRAQGGTAGQAQGDEEVVRCPRCGSEEIERNPYLFGSPDAELTPEDYFAAAMKL